MTKRKPSKQEVFRTAVDIVEHYRSEAQGRRFTFALFADNGTLVMGVVVENAEGQGVVNLPKHFDAAAVQSACIEVLGYGQEEQDDIMASVGLTEDMATLH